MNVTDKCTCKFTKEHQVYSAIGLFTRNKL